MRASLKASQSWSATSALLNASIVVAAAMLSVAACKGSEGGDTTPPTLVSVNPASDATGVLPTTAIQATFDEALDCAGSAGTVAALVVKAGATVVLGTPSCAGATLSFAPSQPLSEGTTFSVTASPPPRDQSGNATLTSVAWSFTTQLPYGWRAKASMPTPRNVLATAVVSGKIYAIGGWTRDAGGTEGFSDAVEEYDPVGDTWTAKAPTPTLRSQLAAAVVDGRVYLMGGFVASGTTDKVEEYDPATDTWSTKASMPTPLAGLAAAVVNGKIYAIGGSSVEEYDPVADTWSAKAPIPTPRYWLAAVAVNGKIYAIGGWDDPLVFNVTKSFDEVEEYDPATDTWTTKAPNSAARGAIAAAVLKGRIHVMGGQGFLNTVEEYDPVTDSWAASLPMPTARNALGAVALNDDIYAIGGWNWHGPLTTVEAYARAESRAPYFREIPGSPFIWTSAVNSNVALLSNDETTLFVSNQISNTVSVLAVAPGGALTLLGVYPTGRVPTGMALDPAEKWLYVATEDGIAVHQVATDRTLTQIGLAAHPAGAGFEPWNGIQYVTSSGGSPFLYANESARPTNFVAAYRVLAGGLLDVPTTWSTGAPGSGSGTGPHLRLVFDGARLFASNDGSVSVLQVKPDGSLALVAGSPFASPLTPAPPVSSPVPPYASALALDPSGSWLYAILDGFTPVRFAVLPDGTLEFDASFVEAPTYPVTGFSVHPSGRWLAAAYGPTWARVWDTRSPGAPVVTGAGGVLWNAAGTLAFLGGGSLTEAVVDVFAFTQ